MYIGTSEFDFGHPNIFVGEPIQMLPHLSVGGQHFLCNDEEGKWSIPEDSLPLAIREKNTVINRFANFCKTPQGFIPMAYQKGDITPQYYFVEKRAENRVDYRRAQGVGTPQQQLLRDYANYPKDARRVPEGKRANIYSGEFYGVCSFLSLLSRPLPIKPLQPFESEGFTKRANIYGSVLVVGSSSLSSFVPSGSFFLEGSSLVPYHFYRTFVDTLGLVNIPYLPWYYKANIEIINK